MKAPERIFICGVGHAPKIVNLGREAPLLWSGLPLFVFGGLFLAVLVLNGVDAPERFIYLAASAGLVALGMETRVHRSSARSAESG